MIGARYAKQWRYVTRIGKLRSVSRLSPLRATSTRVVLSFLAAFAVVFSAGASPAAAVPAPNETVINVNPLLTTALNVAKIKVTPKGAAKGGTAGLYYPVVNATKMNDKFVGTLKHQGGFELKLGAMRFGFKDFVIKTTAKSPVSGVIDATPVFNGMPLPFTMPMSTVTVTSVQKTSTLVIAKYKLAINPEIAKLINATLGVKILTPGDPWATAETRIKVTPPATTPPATNR